MIKEIIKDEAFLRKPSALATIFDVPVAQDLLDTLAANKERCVGMAANMIGVSKQIIAVEDNEDYLLLFNPVIIKQSEPFETEEACLSLQGTRKTKRYKFIKVRYKNKDFKEQTKTFTGWTAQIVQHEIDHCNGIII